MAILITGGARSGKSGFAEQYAARIATRGVYIATSQPFDDEMRERVRLHREEREASGFAWRTIEEPLRLTERLAELAAGAGTDAGAAEAAGKAAVAETADSIAEAAASGVVLVDCLTLWLSNWMMKLEQDAGGDWTSEAERRLEALSDELVRAAAACPIPLLLVTNEVGSGIVPPYPLGRRFRDAAGRLNRRLAEACERVFLVTAGIPVDLKKLAFRLEEL